MRRSRFYYSNTVHNTLNSIADIIKGNILCIVKIMLILFPEALELFTCADLCDNVRVDFQHFAAAALVRCPFQGLQQCFCIALCAAQGVQNMYIVKISWSGIGDAAGQYRLDFLC